MSIDVNPERDSVARLATLLDSEPGLTVDVLRDDFPGWRIWFSAMTGQYHARRDDPSGHYHEHHDDPRRFHIAEATPGRLAILLLTQTAQDDDADG